MRSYGYRVSGNADEHKTGLKSYKDLRVWELSKDLAVEIYQLTRNLPASEKYGLCSQVQRATVSIPSNIAEGYSRNNRGEYLHFLGIASGSAAELETQLILINEIYSIDTSISLNKIKDFQKMLYALKCKLKSS